MFVFPAMMRIRINTRQRNKGSAYLCCTRQIRDLAGILFLNPKK